MRIYKIILKILIYSLDTFCLLQVMSIQFREKIRIQLCSNGVYLQDDDKERVNRLVKECFRLTQRGLDERRGISSRVE